MVDNSDIIVFDREQVKHNRERATANFSDNDFLFNWSKDQLSERISDINRSFTSALQIGSRGCILQGQHNKIDNLITLDLTDKPVQNCGTYIQASEEYLPIAPKSVDLVISNLALHSVNDLPGTLSQIHGCLKDDGLFVASMLGGETLYELRKIMMEVELSMLDGVSPHIHPFADKLQMGSLLQRANFALPIVDSDVVTVTYDNIFKLLHDLRNMGEGNAVKQRCKTNFGKEFFMRVAQKYHEEFAENDGRITASFEVIFLLGWTPHSSQQKPLARGSAKYSLAEALK